MRYLTGLLILFFSFVGVSAAQGHRGGGGGSTHNGGQSHSNSGNHKTQASRPAPFHPEGHGTARPNNERRGNERPSNDRHVRPERPNNERRGNERPDHFRGDQGRHTSDRDRWHFDGRHFDRGWHERHFGREHRFYIGRPVFYGGYYRFWYDGFWFSYYDPWPSDWCYCDQIYIDYDYDSDCYFMYNPYHPGFRIRIGVIF